MGGLEQTLTFPIDPTALPVGLGTSPAMPGMQYQWQVWHPDLTLSSATSNFTNTVSVQFEGP